MSLDVLDVGRERLYIRELLIGSNYGVNLWWNLIKHSNSDLFLLFVLQFWLIKIDDVVD